MKEVLNDLIQSGDIQSGVTDVRFCTRAGLRGVGRWFACGWEERNECMPFLERVSASELHFPGMCLAVRVKFSVASIKNRQRII